MSWRTFFTQPSVTRHIKNVLLASPRQAGRDDYGRVQRFSKGIAPSEYTLPTGASGMPPLTSILGRTEELAGIFPVVDVRADRVPDCHGCMCWNAVCGPRHLTYSTLTTH